MVVRKQQKKSQENLGGKGGELRKGDSPSLQPAKKMSEYGRQLAEKQKVKDMYGMREAQFRRFFSIAKKSSGATGEALLSLLERRIDNVVYRLKFVTTRKQGRQLVVHGHFKVNGVRVFSPSFFVKINDVITFSDASLKCKFLMENVVEKQLATGVKIPGWLELDKAAKSGRVLNMPVRSDVQASINENFIVELYSK